MRTLILYESKMGYTKKCAEYLHKMIENSELFEIESRKFKLEDYDRIIIGAPIYIGEIEEITKDFIKRNQFALLDRKLGLFCAGMSKEEFHIAVQDSLPPNIFYHAEIVHCGGVIEYSKLTLRDKYTIWRRLKIRKSLIDENLEALDKFVE